MYFLRGMFVLTFMAGAHVAEAGWSPPARWDIPVVIDGKKLEKQYPLVLDTGVRQGEPGWVRAVQVCLDKVGSDAKGFLGVSDSPNVNPSGEFVFVADVALPKLPKCFTIAIPKDWKSVYLHGQHLGFPKEENYVSEPECLEKGGADKEGGNKQCAWGHYSIDTK